MKKVIIILAVLALLGAGGYGAYYYFELNSSAETGRVSSASEDAVYVEKISAITGYGTGSGVLIRYSGEAVAQASLEVSLDSERTVKECYVQEGDIVEEGQELFVYDTREDEDKIAQDEIDIEKNQMSIESNLTSIAQQEKLQASAEDEDDRTEAYLQILSLQNENRSYEYEIQKTQIEIESLQESIQDSVVRADMGGYVQKIADQSGDDDYNYYYSENSSYITILSLGDYRIKGTVNELGYDNIEEGMEMVVYSRSDPTQTWKGTVTEISMEKDEDDSDGYYYYNSSDTSTFTFYVELENADGLLLGQHVYMEKNAGQTEEKTGLWLEEYYIMQEDDGHAYVWLANMSNVLEKHEIVLGSYDEDLYEYEVISGLEADDYIAYPMLGLSEGDPVFYSDIAAVTDDWEYDDDDDDLYFYYDDDDDDFYFDDDDDDFYFDDDDDDFYFDDDDDDFYFDGEDDFYFDDDDDFYDDNDDFYFDDEDDYYDDVGFGYEFDDDGEGFYYYDDDLDEYLYFGDEDDG